MSDFYDKVLGDEDPIKKLLAKIPGFKGYVERGDRRMSDKLLRENIAESFESQYQRLFGLQRELISAGGLAYIDDLEAAAIKLRQFIDRIRTAAYGYAGLFDAVKVNEDELAAIYQYDSALLDSVEIITRAIDNVEASIGSDGLSAAIKHLTTESQNVLELFNKRSDALKGVAAQ